MLLLRCRLIPIFIFFSTPPLVVPEVYFSAQVVEVCFFIGQYSAGNGNLEASQTVNYSGGQPSAAARISSRLSFDRAPFARTGSSGLNAGSTGHRSHEDCPGGGLDYGNIRREPIRDVWVEAVNASGTVI